MIDRQCSYRHPHRTAHHDTDPRQFNCMRRCIGKRLWISGKNVIFVVICWYCLVFVGTCLVFLVFKKRSYFCFLRKCFWKVVETVNNPAIFQKGHKKRLTNLNNKLKQVIKAVKTPNIFQKSYTHCQNNSQQIEMVSKTS